MPFTQSIHMAAEKTNSSAACLLVMDYGRSYKDDSTGQSTFIAIGRITRMDLVMRLANIGLAIMQYIK